MYSDLYRQIQKAQQYREQPEQFFHRVNDKTVDWADGSVSYRLRRNGGDVWQCECLYARNSTDTRPCAHVRALEFVMAKSGTLAGN
jgi:hypothetical protein